MKDILIAPFVEEMNGTTAELLWGYEDGGEFTSELSAHLMSQMARLKVDPRTGWSCTAVPLTPRL